MNPLLIMKNILSHKSIHNSFVLDSGTPWITVAIFWWVHGNEIAWVQAIKLLLDTWKQWTFHIQSGKIICAYWNERAIIANKHNVGLNLNRLFRKNILTSQGSVYEINRAKELAQILDESDVLLDIHSTSSDSIPFIFSESDTESIHYAQAFPVQYIITWWSDICGNLISWDTQTYMALQKKLWYTIECGNHQSSNARSIGYNSILHLLNKLKMTDTLVWTNENFKGNIIQMYDIATTNTGMFKFSRNYKNFEPIQEWDIVGHENWEAYKAKETSLMLLPNYEPLKSWDEIFYYWRKINYAKALSRNLHSQSE